MRKINGHNNEYIVLFGSDRYAPDRHANACENRFYSIADARRFAKPYSNAAIFKLHYSGDLQPEYIQDAK